MTIRLYEEYPHRMAFKAKVIQSLLHEGKPAVVLDRTCFYPEGGGQPSDWGMLSSIPVCGAIEWDGEILHLLEAPLPEGAEVEGTIDTTRRWDHMQQHTGQHLLSQAFLRVTGKETIGFHLGEVASTIDLTGELPEEKEVDEVELLVNRVIQEDRPVRIHRIGHKEARDLPFRRIPEEDPLRIVEVEGFDVTACSGTHVTRTGEIGLVKIQRIERYKKGVRLYFCCGMRALADYQRKHRQVRRICSTLSIGEDELAGAIDRLVDERKAQAKEIRRLSAEILALESERLVLAAEPISGYYLVYRYEESGDVNAFRRLLMALVARPRVVVLFGLSSGHVLLGRSQDVPIDLLSLFNDLTKVYGGRGGGTPALVSGRIETETPRDTVLAHAKALLLRCLGEDRTPHCLDF